MTPNQDTPATPSALTPEDFDAQDAVLDALREHDEVVIKDDLCNRDYRFDAQAIDEVFRDFVSGNPPTLH